MKSAKRLLLKILKKVRNVGRRLESKLKGETLSYNYNGPTPVIGFDTYLKDKKGRVLICSVPEALLLPNDSPEIYRHQKYERMLAIVRTFNRLGYIVDVIDVWDTGFVPKEDYSILLGTCPSFKRMAEILPDPVLKINFSVGPRPEFRCNAEQIRCVAAGKRRGKTFIHQYPKGKTSPKKELVDAVITIGNEWVASTYRPYNKSVYPIGTGGYDFIQSTIDDKDFHIARRKFMWMANWMFIGKGLDLVLEVFSQLPELELYVCGGVWNEPDFVEAYQQELFHTPNIHVMGRIKIESKEFTKLTSEVAYTIFPTSCDAVAGGVCATMKSGVIPIVSIENGMDTGDFGITLTDCRLKTIRDAMLQAAETSPEECKNMALRAFQRGKKYYSLEAWSKRFNKSLREILSKKAIIIM